MPAKERLEGKVDIKTITKARERLLILLRENFPLHKEECGLEVYEYGKSIQFYYEDARFGLITNWAGPSTLFDVVPGDYCDIISFKIPEGSRRQGNGRKLYQCIEDLARSYDCKKVVTILSGQGLEFWPKMGLRHEGTFGWEKILE